MKWFSFSLIFYDEKCTSIHKLKQVTLGVFKHYILFYSFLFFFICSNRYWLVEYQWARWLGQLKGVYCGNNEIVFSPGGKKGILTIINHIIYSLKKLLKVSTKALQRSFINNLLCVLSDTSFWHEITWIALNVLLDHHLKKYRKWDSLYLR